MAETRQTFHQELAYLERRVLDLGETALRIVEEAVRSLTQRDLALAEAARAREPEVRDAAARIEENCLRLLALQQPVARDLRQIGMALKCATELDRVSDHAVDLAKVGRRLQRRHAEQPLPIDISPLAEQSAGMLRRALAAVAQRDQALAADLHREEKRADKTFKLLRRQMFALLSEGESPDALEAEPEETPAPPSAPAGQAIVTAYTLLALTALERIAHHAVNIAESVHYLETGYLRPVVRAAAPDA